MASFKSKKHVAGQHYVVCGMKDCEKNCLFYCNPCQKQLCEKCRDKHLQDPNTKNHELVLYQQRRCQLPVEKCRLHPKRNVDIFCKECNIPLCSKCSTMQDHLGHKFKDLEEIYAAKFEQCQSEISKIKEYLLPTSKDLKMDVQEDAKELKNFMERIRKSMKAEAESLKNLIDVLTEENTEQANTMEMTLLKILNSQEKAYEDYIAYLEKLVQEFHSSVPLSNLRLLFYAIIENQTIKTIPETTKPVLPVFTAGQFSKEDVAKLLGRIVVPDTNPERRKIKPMKTNSGFTEKQIKHKTKELVVRPSLSLASSVTKIREYRVPGVDRACHVSLGKAGRLWVSNDIGILVQTDLQGNLLQSLQTSGRNAGYHTVAQDGDLIYAERNKNVLNKKRPNNETTEFTSTEDWKPLSIHSSHINGDILVGMIKNREAKITRYSKTGKEIQSIQKDNTGVELYRYPHYITENINGDICASDIKKQAVVVVTKPGQHRFSYKGQEAVFHPYGICTDVLGHILVCHVNTNTVHLLNHDGRFLSLLLTLQQGVLCPFSACVDNENNLYVGQLLTNTVTVYKYLK
ncbi:uncharacterized protein LOC111120980 [Crassostrea virginica]